MVLLLLLGLQLSKTLVKISMVRQKISHVTGTVMAINTICALLLAEIDVHVLARPLGMIDVVILVLVVAATAPRMVAATIDRGVAEAIRTVSEALIAIVGAVVPEVENYRRQGLRTSRMTIQCHLTTLEVFAFTVLYPSDADICLQS